MSDEVSIPEEVELPDPQDSIDTEAVAGIEVIEYGDSE